MNLTPRLALLLTLPPLMWAGNAVVGRLMVGQIPPLTLNFIRWVLTIALLLPLGWRVLRKPNLVAERLPWLLLISLLGVGMYNSLQYLALVSSTAVNVTLVASSLPVWMLAVGVLFYGERPGWRQTLGACLGLTGVLLVIARGSWQTLAGVQFVAGDLYVLTAIIGWAFYSWQLARPPASMQGSRRPSAEDGWDWAGLLLLQALFGSVAAGAFAAAEQALGAPALRLDATAVAALLYVSLGASIVAYRCWGLGVTEGGPALAAIFGNLTPLFAAIMSAAVLGEGPRWYHVVAFVLIVGGISTSMTLGKPRSASPAT
jgi:drug/metabolite transporter (DMT)-like permease